MIALRDYQQDGVDKIRAAYTSGFRAPLYQLCTGGGKSVIFVHIAKGAMAKGNRVWILVHRKELIHQVSKHLSNQGVPHGFIAAGRPMQQQHLVQIASVQTLVRRLETVIPPDLIIEDECHHAGAESWVTILGSFPDARNLGVSATPLRTNGRGLGISSGGFYDTLICGPSVSDLIEQGHLSRPVYYAPPNGLDLSEVHKLGGDYNKVELETAIDRPKITGSAVDHYTKICAGVPAIVFCVSLKHCAAVMEQFRTAGYRAEQIYGDMEDSIRQKRIEDLAARRIQVLCSVDVLGEGVDIPVVECGIMLRPTASMVLHRQQLGRILRPSPGKTRAICLDHCGNVLRHGLAEDPYEWTLEGKPPGRKKSTEAGALVNVQCKVCYAVFAPAPKCPQCGAVVQIKSREVEQVAGELVELTAEALEARRLKQQVGMAKDRAGLEAIARARGYRPNWVNVILAQRHRKFSKQSDKVAQVQIPDDAVELAL